MDDLLYEKLWESETRKKVYGVHVAGAANLTVNLAVYPLFLLSMQLQLSPKHPIVRLPSGNLSQGLAAFLFTSHPGNKPYTAPQFYGYRPAMLSNLVLGSSALYRGCFMSSLHFYTSLCLQSYTSQLLSDYTEPQMWTDLRHKYLAETLLATLAETIVHPFFTAQARFVLQSNSRCFCVYHDFLDMIRKAGIRELYTGWGGVLPKQAILVGWQYALPYVDVALDAYLGRKKKQSPQVLARETLLASLGFLLIYPILTVQRRAAVQSRSLGMRPFQTRSCTRLALNMLKTEGLPSFLRGISAFAVGVSPTQVAIWVNAMPTVTQYAWLKYEDSVRDELKRIIDD